MDLDEALTDLVTRCGDRLLRVGYQLTHDRASAQDLVQGALLHVYASIRRRGDEPADWYAYLRRAVINEYLQTRRLRSGAEIVTDPLADRLADAEPAPAGRVLARPVAGSPIVADPAERIADREDLWTALGNLSPRQRAVLVLRYYEALPDNEIATVLGCREPTVRSLASRGLAALRDQAAIARIGTEERP
ncbi:MAG: RNA polymerase sigma factor [Streptosporangiaceae bacterium]